MPSMTSFLAIFTDPISAARFAREVIEGGIRVLIVIECHTFQRFIGVELNNIFTKEGNGRASHHVVAGEGLSPILHKDILSERFAISHYSVLIVFLGLFNILRVHKERSSYLKLNGFFAPQQDRITALCLIVLNHLDDILRVVIWFDMRILDFETSLCSYHYVDPNW